MALKELEWEDSEPGRRDRARYLMEEYLSDIECGCVDHYDTFLFNVLNDKEIKISDSDARDIAHDLWIEKFGEFE